MGTLREKTVYLSQHKSEHLLCSERVIILKLILVNHLSNVYVEKAVAFVLLQLI